MLLKLVSWNALSSMISLLYSVKVPVEGNSKTTYNVGTISGGTSVNTIAQDACVMYEYRSDNKNCLAKMQKMFEQAVETFRCTGIEVDVEKVGDRPCSGAIDETAFADWDLSGNWNLSVEGEDTVANPISAGKGFTLKENTEARELSFDFRLNEFGNPHVGNVGVLYYLASGNRFFFEYNPVAKYYQIRRLDAHGNNKDYLAKTENVTLDKTTYHTMKVVVKAIAMRLFVFAILVLAVLLCLGLSLLTLGGRKDLAVGEVHRLLLPDIDLHRGLLFGGADVFNDFLSIHNGVSPSYMMVVLEI